MARPRQFTDEEILTATREVVLREGPSVSTTVIAKEIGLSQAALFKRFGTKASLIGRALIPAEPMSIAAGLMDGPDDRPIDVQLNEIGTTFQKTLTKIVPLMMALKNSGINIHDLALEIPVPPPVILRLAIIEWLKRAEAQGRLRALDHEATAQLFMGGLASRAMLRHMLGERSQFAQTDEAFVAGAINTIWNGIAPVEAT